MPSTSKIGSGWRPIDNLTKKQPPPQRKSPNKGPNGKIPPLLLSNGQSALIRKKQLPLLQRKQVIPQKKYQLLTIDHFKPHVKKEHTEPILPPVDRSNTLSHGTDSDRHNVTNFQGAVPTNSMGSASGDNDQISTSSQIPSLERSSDTNNNADDNSNVGSVKQEFNNDITPPTSKDTTTHVDDDKNIRKLKKKIAKLEAKIEGYKQNQNLFKKNTTIITDEIFDNQFQIAKLYGQLQTMRENNQNLNNFQDYLINDLINTKLDYQKIKQNLVKGISHHFLSSKTNKKPKKTVRFKIDKKNEGGNVQKPTSKEPLSIIKDEEKKSLETSLEIVVPSQDEGYVEDDIPLSQVSAITRPTVKTSSIHVPSTVATVDKTDKAFPTNTPVGTIPKNIVNSATPNKAVNTKTPGNTLNETPTLPESTTSHVPQSPTLDTESADVTQEVNSTENRQNIITKTMLHKLEAGIEKRINEYEQLEMSIQNKMEHAKDMSRITDLSTSIESPYVKQLRETIKGYNKALKNLHLILNNRTGNFQILLEKAKEEYSALEEKSNRNAASMKNYIEESQLYMKNASQRISKLENEKAINDKKLTEIKKRADSQSAQLKIQITKWKELVTANKKQTAINSSSSSPNNNNNTSNNNNTNSEKEVQKLEADLKSSQTLVASQQNTIEILSRELYNAKAELATSNPSNNNSNFGNRDGLVKQRDEYEKRIHMMKLNHRQEMDSLRSQYVNVLHQYNNVLTNSNGTINPESPEIKMLLANDRFNFIREVRSCLTLMSRDESLKGRIPPNDMNAALNLLNMVIAKFSHVFHQSNLPGGNPLNVPPQMGPQMQPAPYVQRPPQVQQQPQQQQGVSLFNTKASSAPAPNDPVVGSFRPGIPANLPQVINPTTTTTTTTTSTSATTAMGKQDGSVSAGISKGNTPPPTTNTPPPPANTTTTTTTSNVVATVSTQTDNENGSSMTGNTPLPSIQTDSSNSPSGTASMPPPAKLTALPLPVRSTTPTPSNDDGEATNITKPT